MGGRSCCAEVIIITPFIIPVYINLVEITSAIFNFKKLSVRIVSCLSVYTYGEQIICRIFTNALESIMVV